MEHAGVINSSRFFSSFDNLPRYDIHVKSVIIKGKRERETYLVLNFQLDTFFLNRSCSYYY